MAFRKFVFQTLFAVTLSVACSAGVAYYLDYRAEGRLADQFVLLDRERAIFRDYATRVASYDEFRMGYGPARLPATCVDDAMESIRQADGDVREAFSKCKDILAQQIPVVASKVSENDLMALFITIVVNRLAPYGESSAVDPEDILEESTLNCAQHSLMVAYLVKKYVPGVKVLERIGLDGGVIGNHALVYYESNTAKLILDGTTAMITLADFNEVISGKTLSVYDMYDFFASADEYQETFRRNVRGAYRLGAVRAKHVMYRENMLAAAPVAQPQAAAASSKN